MALLEFTDKGIWCQQAGVFIDPWRPVERAIITHGHSDHARRGMGHYLCHHYTEPILKARLGNDITVQGVEYGERLERNGVHISLHPAGHVIGSAQVRVEYKGEVWVVSGDYKVQDDGFATSFEPVKCHVFITECTFGLPVYKWQPQQEVMDDINRWWAHNRAEGKASVISAYSLGKAQRIIQNVDHAIGTIYTHGAIDEMNKAIMAGGVALKPTTYLDASINRKELAGSLVIAPPGALGTPWANKLGDMETAAASGWMALRGTRRRMAVDRGFALSDHADWVGLNDAIAATGAERIITTHGYTDIFTRWLQEQGYQATVEHTQFEGDAAEVGEPSSNATGEGGA